MHRIAVPLLVVPLAPTGEQNAPGCTPDCDDVVRVLVGFGRGRLVDTFGLGFGAAVVRFGVGRTVVFDGAGTVVGGGVVSSGVGSVVTGRVEVGAMNGAAVAACFGVFLPAGSSTNSPMAVTPPQHRARTARVPVRASRHPVSHFGRWRGCGVVGWFQVGCTRPGWTLAASGSIVCVPHVWAIQPFPDSRSSEPVVRYSTSSKFSR